MSRGLPRTPDSFPRVYSPPEPPRAPRRSTVTGVLVAMVAVGVASAAVFLLNSGSGGRPAHAPSAQAASSAVSDSAAPDPASSAATPEGTSQSATAATAPVVPTGARPFTHAPAPCAAPDQSTINNLIPGPQTVQRITKPGDPTCIVTSGDGSSSSLVVETRLNQPGQGPDPVSAAEHDFTADLTAAQQGNGYDRTLSLDRQQGLGDEAFRWAKLDKGGPTAVIGQVEVRIRNGVVIVTYSQNARSGESAPAAGKRLLDAATMVARQVLGSYS